MKIDDNLIELEKMIADLNNSKLFQEDQINDILSHAFQTLILFFILKLKLKKILNLLKFQIFPKL